MSDKETHIDRLLKDASGVTEPHRQLVLTLLEEIRKLRRKEPLRVLELVLKPEVRPGDVCVLAVCQYFPPEMAGKRVRVTIEEI